MKRIAAAVLTVGVIAALAVAAPAAAGDGSSLMYGEEDTYTVEPGEEVEVVIFVSDHGSAVGDGLEHVLLEADYNPDQLEATAVESEGWFESDDDSITVDSNSNIDTDEGVVTLNETRSPAGDGTTATEPFATITFVADEDATGATTVNIENSRATLAGGFEKPLFFQPVNEGPNGPQIQIEAGTELAPGLTVVTAVIALLLAVVVAARRQKER